jgi:hypothetical protein
MRCNEWNNEWITSLYEEMDESELNEMERHLADCEGCRHHLQQLSETHHVLSESSPAIDPSGAIRPRVVVLDTARGRRGGSWRFAGGFAAAAALFALGIFVGIQTFPRQPVVLASSDDGIDLSNPRSTQVEAIPAADLTHLKQNYETLEQRLGRIENWLPQDEGERRPRIATENRLQLAVGRLNQEFDQRRAEDLEFLFDAILAADAEARQRDTRTLQVLEVMEARRDPNVRPR